MLRLLRNKKAQNTAEYAILIALVIGVFSAMQLYVRRGMQARIRGGMDSIPDMVVSQEADQTKVDDLFGNQTQYEPYYLREGSYDMTTQSSEGAERGTITESGGVREVTGATSSRTGSQEITGAEEDD